MTESTVVRRDPKIDARRKEHRIALVCKETSRPVDGIRDYSFQLAHALRQFEGVSAEVRGRDVFDTAVDGYDTLVLQYNPFMYGRWGFAPWLPAAVLRTRRKRRTLEVALMVHEPYVPMVNWRWTLMGLWQRSQLLALHTVSDVVFASIEVWAAAFARLRPRRPTHHLPVGSNLPDMRSRREAARVGLDASEETIVLTAFGTSDPARQFDFVVAAANAVADSGLPTILQHLGAGAPVLSGLKRSVRVSEPGCQSAASLAERLAATDVFLAPFVDGVSTRRGTLMAALQHGLPIVATDGHRTDETLRRSDQAIRLAPVARQDLFVEAVRQLAQRPDEREVLGASAHSLYIECFDWPVVAGRLLRLLSSREATAA